MMKVNILFTIEEMARRRADAGPSDKNLHVRASGRTTGIALEAIGYAMKEDNHGKILTIPRDHYLRDTVHSGTHVAHAMEDLIDKMGLKGFTINHKDLSYRYRVIYEV